MPATLSEVAKGPSPCLPTSTSLSGIYYSSGLIMDNAQKPTHEDYLKVLEENARLRTENEMLKQTKAKKAKVKVATLTQVTVKVLSFEILGFECF